MHLVTSINFAIGVSWRAGAGTVDAERRTRSCSPNSGAPGATEGFGSGGNMATSSYATGPDAGSMLTRNALYSGVSMLASPTYGVSEFGPKPFFAAPMKPQCSGM